MKPSVPVRVLTIGIFAPALKAALKIPHVMETIDGRSDAERSDCDYYDYDLGPAGSFDWSINLGSNIEGASTRHGDPRPKRLERCSEIDLRLGSDGFRRLR